MAPMKPSRTSKPCEVEKAWASFIRFCSPRKGNGQSLRLAMNQTTIFKLPVTICENSLIFFVPCSFLFHSTFPSLPVPYSVFFSYHYRHHNTIVLLPLLIPFLSFTESLVVFQTLLDIIMNTYNCIVVLFFRKYYISLTIFNFPQTLDPLRVSQRPACSPSKTSIWSPGAEPRCRNGDAHRVNWVISSRVGFTSSIIRMFFSLLTHSCKCCFERCRFDSVGSNGCKERLLRMSLRFMRIRCQKICSPNRNSTT